MPILTNTLGVIFGLALLAALGLGAVSVIQGMSDLFARLDPQTAAVSAILSIVLLLAAIIIAGGGTRTARRAMATRVQAERAAVYGLLLDVWERLLRSPAPPPEDEQLPEALRALELRLALYGSAAVLKAHRRLAALLDGGRIDVEVGRMALIEAVLAIRGELGTGRAGLDREALRRTLFPDLPRPAAPTVAPARVVAAEAAPEEGISR